MTQTLDEFQKEMKEHNQNQSECVANISQIKRNRIRDKLLVEFSLPEGDEKIIWKIDDINGGLDMLYQETTARPPRIDSLIGESIPVQWNEESGEWDIDYESSTLVDDGSDNISYQGAEKWSTYMWLSLVSVIAVGYISIEWAIFALENGEITYFGVVMTIFGLSFIAAYCYWFVKLKRFYNEEYAWINTGKKYN